MILQHALGCSSGSDLDWLLCKLGRFPPRSSLAAQLTLRERFRRMTCPWEGTAVSVDEGGLPKRGWVVDQDGSYVTAVLEDFSVARRKLPRAWRGSAPPEPGAVSRTWAILPGDAGRHTHSITSGVRNRDRFDQDQDDMLRRLAPQIVSANAIMHWRFVACELGMFRPADGIGGVVFVRHRWNTIRMDAPRVATTGVDLIGVMKALEGLPDCRGSSKAVRDAYRMHTGSILNTDVAAGRVGMKVWESGVLNALSNHRDIFRKVRVDGCTHWEFTDAGKLYLAGELDPPVARRRRHNTKESKRALDMVRAYGQLAGR